MNPKTLRALAEIVELGSFSRAAEALNVTQPTLSQSIKQLEAVVGAPVLKRGRHGVTPTKIGEVLAREGRAIRSALAYAEEGLAQWRVGVEGHLKIGVGPMLAQTIMPGFIERLLDERWNTGLRIYTEGADRLVARVRSAELDLALAPARLRSGGEELIGETVIEDQLGIYVGVGHPLARRKKINNDELEALEWISSGHMLGPRDATAIVSGCLGLKMPKAVLSFSGDVSMPLSLVRSGKFAVIFPDFLMRQLPARQQFARLPIDIDTEYRNVALWYRRDMIAHPNIVVFRERLMAYLRSLQLS